jgi:PKD repeat protein
MVQTTTPTISHSFDAGVHTVTLVAVDDDGLHSPPVTVTVRASDPPTAAASVPVHARSGQTVVFDATASSDPDGDIVTYTYEFGDGTSVTTSADRVPHTFTTSGPVRLAWRIVVTDDAGLQDAVTGTIKITP